MQLLVSIPVPVLRISISVLIARALVEVPPHLDD
jgi:hypothetical protein